MNVNLPGVIMFVAGVILMYSAVKNKKPQQVIFDALGKKPPREFGPIVPPQPPTQFGPSVPFGPTIPATNQPGTTWVSV